MTSPDAEQRHPSVAAIPGGLFGGVTCPAQSGESPGWPGSETLPQLAPLTSEVPRKAQLFTHH